MRNVSRSEWKYFWTGEWIRSIFLHLFFERDIWSVNMSWISLHAKWEVWDSIRLVVNKDSVISRTNIWEKSSAGVIAFMVFHWFYDAVASRRNIFTTQPWNYSKQQKAFKYIKLDCIRIHKFLSECEDCVHVYFPRFREGAEMWCDAMHVKLKWSFNISERCFCWFWEKLFKIYVDDARKKFVCRCQLYVRVVCFLINSA